MDNETVTKEIGIQCLFYWSCLPVEDKWEQGVDMIMLLDLPLASIASMALG